MRAPVTLFWILPVLTTLLLIFIPGYSCKKADSKKFGEKIVVFDFDQINFEGNLPDGVTLIQNLNTIKGIKVYKGEVYVTIPRHGKTAGIPATLARITTEYNKVRFSPFPNWDLQNTASCKNLQDVRSIQVDPQTNLMYIADNGNAETKCEAKLVIYDLAKKVINSTYTFKGKGPNGIRALGDIVVDNNGLVYIANSDKYGSMWIVSTKNGESYFVNDHSFRGVDFQPFVSGNDTYTSETTISMLALTPDSKFLFYSSNNKALWQVESDIKVQKLSLTSGEIKDARKTGDKKFQGFSIEMGNRFLFFSNVDNKSISYWDRNMDLVKQGEGGKYLVKENEEMVNIHPKLEYFPGKMSLDEEGYLWVVTMDLPRYFNQSENADPKTKIVKIFVNNRPYNNPEKTVSSSGGIFLSAFIVIICCLLTSM